jgi:hypothetical protein
MKKVIALGLFLSLNAFATEVTLSPGASAKIAAGETTTVTCAGAQDVAPRCTIKLNASGNYDVLIGADRSTTEYSNDNAIRDVQNYQKAGLCR